jgi:hypothetical protein
MPDLMRYVAEGWNSGHHQLRGMLGLLSEAPGPGHIWIEPVQGLKEGQDASPPWFLEELLLLPLLEPLLPP